MDEGMGWARRAAFVLSASVLTAIAVASCGGGSSADEDCAVVGQRCRLVCGYYGYYGYSGYCDPYWGCCYEQCWYECLARKPPPSASQPPPAPPPPAIDASTDAAPPPSDGGSGGRGVLCSPCTSNADCQSGALCIQRGGADAGTSFCGHACQTSAECPAGFTCTDIGAVKQCVPTSGVCE